MDMQRNPCRRRLVSAAVLGAVTLALPALATSRRRLPPMTDGPFYPPLAYRSRSVDWDADLTEVRGTAPDGQPRPRALGEHLDLHGPVIDVDGRVVDGAEVEIWQCDFHASYRHPRGAADRIDEGFQGFGVTRSDARGIYRFRTIRPLPYPGRTPHIHVKVRHASFGELTSQLFVTGDPGNAQDFLYRQLSEEDRRFTDMVLQRAPSGSPTVWQTERSLVVGR